MDKTYTDIYRRPYTGKELTLLEEESNGNTVIQGKLKNKTGDIYDIEEGIPLFIRNYECIK